jgi:uncharacterized integral membrane protein (TIGR00697 family)
LLAEFIGVKIFSLEATLGMKPIKWALPNFNLTAGVLLWPVVFIMTDIINEYFGKKGVRFLSFSAVGVIGFAFLAVNFAIYLSPAEFWTGAYQNFGVVNMQNAYSAVFGQGLWIIAGSIIAFLIGQILDVFVFQEIKKRTGEKKLWLRATGSTLVSQFIDSFVVLFIAFYLSNRMDLSTVIQIGIVNYIFKFIVAIALTPLLYLIHGVIDSYLGDSLASELKNAAKA